MGTTKFMTLSMILTFVSINCSQPKPEVKIDKNRADDMFQELIVKSGRDSTATVTSNEQKVDLRPENSNISNSDTPVPMTRDYPMTLSNGWIRSRGLVEWSEEKTKKQLQAEALLVAFSEAIAYVNGIRIQEVTSIYEDTENGLKIAQMVKEVRGGLIIDRLDPIWNTMIRPEEVFPYALQVTIDVEVEPGTGKSDPGFQVHTFKLNRQDYQSGDQMMMEISASKDCYITIFNRSHCDPEGTITVLFPNEYASSNFIQKDEILSIPDSDRWRLRMGVPEGFTDCTESITIVATIAQVPFKTIRSEKWISGYLQIDYSSQAEELARWLLNIPLDERAEATRIYRSHSILKQ